MAKKKYTRESLLAEYKTLTMRADKRLQRLEKYMQRPGYGVLKQGAYKRAIRDIEKWSGKGHKRFGTKAPENPKDPEDITELQAKLNDIKTFLRSTTSTITGGIDSEGIADMYQRTANTFNKRYNRNAKNRLTWNEIGDYYESEMAKTISARVQSSDAVARALGRFKALYKRNSQTGDELRAKIEKNPNRKFTDDAVVNEAMHRMLKAGLNPEEFFGKG